MGEIKNAKITNVSLTMRDYGCLTFYITLESSSWGVNIGGYCIGHGFLGADEFSAEDGSGLVAMMKIMDVIGVERWEDLKGKYCRINYCGHGSTVNEIGNLLEEKWFNIKEFFENHDK